MTSTGISRNSAYCQHIQTTDESMLVMIFLRGLEITLQHAVQLARPTTLMEAYESAWKAHLGPAPPWTAYIEKTRHEDMEKLKTAMHGELEEFSHQAGYFITRSHSEFIRQQEEKYAARAKTHRRKDGQPGQSRSPKKRFSTDPRCNVYRHHHHHQPRHHGISSTGQPRCSGTRPPNDPRHR